MLTRIQTIFLLVIALLTSGELLAMSKPPGTGYTATKYPIVLAHGLFGFDDLLGIDYWYKVPETLRQDGAQVFVTQVANSNSPEIRGEQLISQVEQILALTGAEKVNLIGHSHGGPTTRYVASVRPDLIASVTTIAGVNRGTPVADTLTEWSEKSQAFEAVISALGNGLAKVIDGVANGGFEQDILASMRSMTTAEAIEFNKLHGGGIPATECGEGAYVDNGIHYFSWTGAQPVTNILDPFDLLTSTTKLFFPEGVRNDGLVGVCASHLGMVIRNDFRMNHLDEVNQLLGIHHLTETDPLTVFRTHANRLKQTGL